MTISVNTFYGLTEPFTIPELVAQGDLFAPLQAAVQVDSMTRKLEEEDKSRVEAGEQGLLFRYKGIVPVPSLVLMDDNITVSEAGVTAEQVNIFMNENSAEKNCNSILKKCKFMKIGKNQNSSQSQTLEVDSWDVKYDSDDTLVETEGG